MTITPPKPMHDAHRCWLDRIDAVYAHTSIGERVPLRERPSDY